MNSPCSPALRTLQPGWRVRAAGFACAITLALPPLVAAAQSSKSSDVPAGPAASAGPAREETVTLSPFEVNASEDAGYRATNTLDGSRLNTALRDTPGAISVFTRDLLDDLGATNVMEILRYDVNSEENYADDSATASGQQVGTLGDADSWRTRGLEGSASVDGFRAIGKTDMYNVESVGSSRGPNAILFGSGAAGGVLNLRTKQANPVRSANNIEFKIGDNSTRRASVDFNRSLIKNKLALRAMGMIETQGSPYPHKYTDREGFTVATQYRFRPDTSINLSFENTRTSGISGRPWGPFDSVTLFLSELQAGRVVWSAARERYETTGGQPVGAAQGVGNLANRTVLVQGPELGTPALWEGVNSATNRTTLSTTASRFNGVKPVVDESVIPYGAVLASGGHEWGVIKFRNFSATINHRWFDKLYMELAFNQATRHSDANIGNNPDIRADLNYRLPNGALNPYFFGNGYYFIQLESVRQTHNKDNKTMRASFSYEIGDANRWWGNHRFAAMVERNVANEWSYRTRAVWDGAPFGGQVEVANNHVLRRRYFKIDGPHANYTGGYIPEGPFTTQTFTSANLAGRSLATTWVPNNALNYDDEITTDSQLFVMQNFLLKRRLVTTFGLRRDQIDSTSPNTVRDALTREWRLATAADQPEFARTGGNWIESTPEKGGRHSVGAVFHVTPNFSLTANASNGVGINRRNRVVLPEEVVPDSSKGKGADFGIGFSFLENRVSGSIKRFESKSIKEGGQNLVQEPFVFPNNDVMSSFDYYFRQAGVTTFGASDPIRSIDELRTTWFSAATGYLSDRESKGYEFETVANLTRNWTVRANYSNTTRMRTNVLSEGDGWWAERVEFWQQLDRLYTTRTGRPSIYNQPVFDRNNALINQTVAQRIADSDRELREIRMVEEQGYGNRRHKANVWTRYMMTEGRLRGLSFGGGWRYQSANIAGVNTATGQVLPGNARSLFDAMAAYRTRGFFGQYLNKVAVTYQLNVVNLLDDRTIMIARMAVDTVTGAPYVNRAFREDPRTSTFSMRLAF